MKRIDAKVAETTGEKRDGKKEEDQGRRDTERKGREDVIEVQYRQRREGPTELTQKTVQDRLGP